MDFGKEERRVKHTVIVLEANDHFRHSFVKLLLSISDQTGLPASFNYELKMYPAELSLHLSRHLISTFVTKLIDSIIFVDISFITAYGSRYESPEWAKDSQNSDKI